MRKLTTVIIISFISILLLSLTVQADKPDNNIDKEFNIDLSGYELHSFGSFNQLGYKITSLAQLYFGIIEREQEWIDEPRLYIKGNKGYVHLWKKDGTNVLYKVEKQPSGLWEIIDVQRKKINRIPVSKTHLKEVLIERLLDPISEAIHNYYGEYKLWYRGLEKVLQIEKDERENAFLLTVQVQTVEGAHNPPYGEETITFRISGSDIKVVDYKHRDIPEEEWTKLELR
ncbi:DUF3888 domain-containing protein [Aquibacillus sp. 3ASR75-11]|uniref:DUF3888 domain-containing protein n=1 Tax=Terrihalobacillus insolitus TaxID=2950438 RepID=A0A9X3WWE8_9BACI|nr:DUF3888 domain-containing protein [Terrihalobacillus insolitus]MDC3414482.1 DUF3888 domain-containing protein [Terrihalobacillus insolitus]MDC3426043.1 DUF3888 domain-containing protein [Terrihalobacillus insolitus]